MIWYVKISSSNLSEGRPVHWMSHSGSIEVVGIPEVEQLCDRVEDIEDGCHSVEQHGGEANEKEYEVPVVKSSDAVTDPDAVMVKFEHAYVAYTCHMSITCYLAPPTYTLLHCLNTLCFFILLTIWTWLALQINMCG